MSAPRSEEYELLQRAKSDLQRLLGEGWTVTSTPAAEVIADAGYGQGDAGFDEVWAIKSRAASTTARLYVDAKSAVAPAQAARVRVTNGHLLQELGAKDAVVLVTPWISPRSREVLDSQGIGYLDLTGNVSIRLTRPPVIIKTEGAQRSPAPEQRATRGLSGPRAGRLVRELVDFQPPHTASDLMERTKLSQGYVSRLLETMTNEALVEREGRVITEVDWSGLLRARASSYQLMRTGLHVPVIARRGRGRLLEELSNKKLRHKVVATGSFVAEQVAPLAVGGALLLYVPAGPHVVDEVAKDLALLRTDRGANQRLGATDVLLLQAPSDVPMLRTQRIDGIECVGYSQLVLDCLSGPGRMPAEGEAVLSWMKENETRWRGRSPLHTLP